MKKLLLLLSATFILTSCSKSKEEVMMQDFLNAKLESVLRADVEKDVIEIIEITETGTVKASDSLDQYKLKLKSETKDLSDAMFRLYSAYVKSNDSIKAKETNNDIMELTKGNVKGYPELETLDNKIKSIEAEPNKVISKVYKGTYKIKDREITKFFYTNESFDKFVSYK
tara:strand:- start:1530 stop:2039 length:510 start_codon:yes stop_codon:yes gene_type:complete